MSQRSMPHDAASWACPHGQDARRGCANCYEESVDPGLALPFWDALAWFTSERPIPIRTLQDAHNHSRRFALDQPSAPLVYLLSGETRARDGVQAVAGLVGFLLHNRHVVTDFTVTETRATPRARTGGTARQTDVWLHRRGP
ncbi:hypothetical protein [Streptosporangium carneum]|uniref:Uncharacterized protein n=1 Tax=Streptosporangium carneum TaxID=47481 RepID=A0A9W6MEL8_9ACTN|nr:hypothetical protein [Streptosporangium carneum]GLK11110.1 hypothetical protein GCM10017600_45160 [Streptosporangium carneum]